MLRAALLFFVLGLVAMLLGATGVAGLSLEVGKIVLYVFLALTVISLVVGLITGKRPKSLP